MSTLSEHIKTAPEKSMAAWAKDFGISRPYLYSLLNGSRNPSLDVARQISMATAGSVAITVWPNLSAVVRAARPAKNGKRVSA